MTKSNPLNKKLKPYDRIIVLGSNVAVATSKHNGRRIYTNGTYGYAAFSMGKKCCVAPQQAWVPQAFAYVLSEARRHVYLSKA